MKPLRQAKKATVSSTNRFRLGFAARDLCCCDGTAWGLQLRSEFFAGGFAHAKPRSREAAKGNAQGLCLVFSGRWSLGKPRTVVRGCGARKFCSRGGTRIVGRLKSRQNS